MIPWLLACRPPPLPPPPAEYLAPAPAYTTGTPEGDDLDHALTSAIAERVGARPDDGALRLARALVARERRDGRPPDPLEVEQMALEAGVPLGLYTWGTIEDKERWLAPVLAYYGEPDEEGAYAVGAAAIPISRRRWLAAVVVLDDAFRLEAPIPRQVEGPTDLRITWTGPGLPRVLSYGPDGLVATDLLVSRGVATGRIPGPGATGVRHDLVRVSDAAGVENSDVVGSFDQPAADGSVPAAPALADGPDPVRRVVASLDALRALRGHPPLALVDIGTPCENWPTEVDGEWIGDQQCWDSDAESWQLAWSSSAARPAFLDAVSRGAMDLVDVDVSGGLAIHLLDRFERLDPTTGADRVAALLAAKWGAERVPSDPAFLQAQVDAYAAAPEVDKDAVIETVVQRPDLALGEDVAEVVVIGLGGATIEQLVEVADVGFVPRRFAVAYQAARDEHGVAAHYAIVVAAR